MTVTQDDLYRRSSQYWLWSFCREDLDRKRVEVNKKACVKVKADLARLGIDRSVLEPIGATEEETLVRFYASKVEDITRFFQMPSQVRATAVAFLRRFYLEHSVMEYQPKRILHTCVFLASKAENHFIPIDRFCSVLKDSDPQEFLALEFVLLQTLKFTLTFHSALDPVHGLYLDMQAVLADTIPTGQLGVLHDKARARVLEGLMSDCIFLYTPPQIALAAMRLTDKYATELYLERKIAKDTWACIFPSPGADLWRLLDDAAAELQACRVLTSEQGRKLDRQVYWCLNPVKFAEKRSLGDTSDPSKRAKVAST